MRPLARILAAEAIGTFTLVFAGAGAVMVDAKTHALGQVGIAATWETSARHCHPAPTGSRSSGRSC
jgi:glycerol uptake facilitator-like aquaporin